MKHRAIILALVVVLLLAGAVFVRGRTRVLAHPESDIRDLTVTPLGVFWVSVPGEEPHDLPAQVWCLARGTRQPRPIVQAWDVRSIAIADGKLYVLLENGPEEDAGELRVIDLKTSQSDSRQGLHAPQGLVIDGSQVFWTETRAARADAIVHIPIMRPVHAIRSADGVSSDASLVSLGEGSERHFTGELLAVHDGDLYWTERLGCDFSVGVTLLNRKSPSDRDVETVARVKGQNWALLDGDCAYWTAYSEELAVPSSGRVVRRQPLPDGEQATVTDWLGPRGALVADRLRIYFATGGHLYLIPRSLDPPTPVVRTSAYLPGAAAVYRDNLYSVELIEHARAIIRTPLSWRGYLWAALTFGKTHVASALAGGRGAGQ